MDRQTTDAERLLQLASALFGILIVLFIFSLGMFGYGPAFRWARQGLNNNTTALTGAASYKMMSDVMSPTVSKGEGFMADEHYYRREPLRRGEVILMALPDRPDVVSLRRVIGVPGDSVEIRHGGLIINGKSQLEPYVSGDNRTYPESLFYGPIHVPQGMILVLGDNRDTSKDSRYWGCIRKSLVRGKAMTISTSGNSARRFTLIK